ncbi:Spermidine/putrescine import ATP-binding protein PotA [Pseudodesulfovibrio hydrargyri]|uniref:Spermidine/putrescine import ATP-binding protein PotA n=1 Tax=Pseudodesulfovibrio hydrargyri TaxID=2125990 RepID=A0A1J5NG65_9BACT|nr:ABC transporter ATP-binding protein [Pseudodesulfovibrio hydrargyri]OIQ50689.1 Spermidine/putrescine import ATP-binding protein PotA [Pseudodesulfovibrio hydrargyri]
MDEVVLKGVTRTFGSTTACAGVDLCVARGELFTFLGPSGCGKTTILRLIAGFLAPQSGSILLGGRDITRLPPEKREVGMVFQNYALFPYLTVARNVEYGLRVRRRTKAEIRSTVARYLEMVGLSGFEERRIDELSGGEQQRVALARSLAVEPRVLLLDEPLSNLDARLRDRTREELRNLQRELGITTIFVTHDQNEALTLSDRIAVFDRGRLVQTGTPADIYGRPRNGFVAGFVGDTNLIEADWRDGLAVVPSGRPIRAGSAGPGRYVAVRPQDVRLSSPDAPASPDDDNVFEGRVTDAQLNGVWIDYRVRAGGMDLRAAALNTVAGDFAPRPGDTVRVSFPARAVMVLEA